MRILTNTEHIPKDWNISWVYLKGIKDSTLNSTGAYYLWMNNKHEIVKVQTPLLAIPASITQQIATAQATATNAQTIATTAQNNVVNAVNTTNKLVATTNSLNTRVGVLERNNSNVINEYNISWWAGARQNGTIDQLDRHKLSVNNTAKIGTIHLDFIARQNGSVEVGILPSNAPTPMSLMENRGTNSTATIYIEAGSRSLQWIGLVNWQRYIIDLVGFFNV